MIIKSYSQFTDTPTPKYINDQFEFLKQILKRPPELKSNEEELSKKVPEEVPEKILSSEPIPNGLKSSDKDSEKISQSIQVANYIMSNSPTSTIPLYEEVEKKSIIDPVKITQAIQLANYIISNLQPPSTSIMVEDKVESKIDPEKITQAIQLANYITSNLPIKIVESKPLENYISNFEIQKFSKPISNNISIAIQIAKLIIDGIYLPDIPSIEVVDNINNITTYYYNEVDGIKEEIINTNNKNNENGEKNE